MCRKYVVFGVFGILLMGVNASAAIFTGGVNTIVNPDLIHITTPDGIADNTFAPDNPDNDEDQEVEQGALATQTWDNESFLWDQTNRILYLVSGFDFAAQIADYAGGDLFFINAGGGIAGVLDIDRLVAGPGGMATTDSDGNNVADANRPLDFGGTDPGTANADLILNDALDPIVYLESTNISASDPYAYHSGGGDTGIDVTVSYYQATSGNLSLNGDIIAMGGDHYIMEFDLSGLTLPGHLVHFTQGCGNDSIHGGVPEPTSILMASVGLLGVTLGRRKFRKYLKS